MERWKLTSVNSYISTRLPIAYSKKRIHGHTSSTNPPLISISSHNSLRAMILVMTRFQEICLVWIWLGKSPNSIGKSSRFISNSSTRSRSLQEIFKTPSSSNWRIQRPHSIRYLYLSRTGHLWIKTVLSWVLRSLLRSPRMLALKQWPLCQMPLRLFSNGPSFSASCSASLKSKCMARYCKHSESCRL